MMKFYSLAGLAITAFLAGCASSSTHLVGQARPSINPEQVRIYHPRPAHFPEIARIDDSTSAPVFYGYPQPAAAAITTVK